MLPVTPTNEYMYDSEWVNNVYNYAQSELIDPTVGDDWKCVIYDAFSQYNPQTAASLSTQLMNWGSGNTYTNTLYFIATRSNSAGGSICSNMTTNPSGTFKIVTTSGQYVVSSSGSPNLVASTSSSSAATSFKLAWLPNAGTIQSAATNEYVTADQSGTDAIAATKGSASSYETFIIRPKVGAGNGVYSIKANSNNNYIVVGSGGSLINSGTTEASSTGFQFV